MNAEIILDVAADSFGRVSKFCAASGEIRHFLCGVHVVPCDGGVCMEGTDGHRLYVEQDSGSRADKNRILKISKAGVRFLREGNRVTLTDAGELAIRDRHGLALYIEPAADRVIDGTFPDVVRVLGDPSKWEPGLLALVNANYLRSALELPGAIAFWRKSDSSDETDAILFTVEQIGGNKGFGAIMPMRGTFKADADIAAFLPLRYRAQPEVAPGAVPPAEQATAQEPMGEAAAA